MNPRHAGVVTLVIIITVGSFSIGQVNRPQRATPPITPRPAGDASELFKASSDAYNGLFQAVPDGDGGIFIINTRDTSVVKHIVRTGVSFKAEYLRFPQFGPASIE